MRELTQIKLILPFVEIPPRIGKQRILKSLEEQVTEAIKHDTLEIIKKGLAEINSVLLVEILQQLHQAIQGLPDSITKSNLSQQLRFLMLVIQNRLEQIHSPETLPEILEQITQDIGSVPELNIEIPLPAQAFLPRNFEKTVRTWERIIWQHPSRESRGERLEFFLQRGVDYKAASVRLHLISLDKDSQRHDEALSYAEADFYQVGNLQADHLQPSEDIIKRQMELVEAMNLDPIFKEKIISKASGKGYFKEEGGIVYGTKRFYMEYHNCVGNLWLISTAAGTKKSNKDVIEWLEQHERFGTAFFDNIGGKESINCQGILYTTQDGSLLAKAARTWFQVRYGQEITAAGYVLHQIKEPLLRQVDKIEQCDRKRRRIKLMAKMATAAQLVEGDDPSSSNGSLDQYSSPSSSDAEITEKNLAQMRRFAAEKKAVWSAEIGGVVKDYTAEVKGKRKAGNSEKVKDEVEGNNDDVDLHSSRLIKRGK
jgi:hypothetical protein